MAPQLQTSFAFIAKLFQVLAEGLLVKKTAEGFNFMFHSFFQTAPCYDMPQNNLITVFKGFDIFHYLLAYTPPSLI